jgi:hypothetical protein
MEYILSQIDALLRIARDHYGVNPIIFLAIYFTCTPVFYYSIFRTLRAIAKKLSGETMLWSAIFMAATVAPFLYVILFGRNIPWWVFLLIALLIGQGVIALIRKIRQNAPTKKGE